VVGIQANQVLKRVLNVELGDRHVAGEVARTCTSLRADDVAYFDLLTYKIQK
jgi:hypothetical protein